MIPQHSAEIVGLKSIHGHFPVARGRWTNGKFPVWSAAVGTAGAWRTVFWRAAARSRTTSRIKCYCLSFEVVFIISSFISTASSLLKKCFIFRFSQMTFHIMYLMGASNGEQDCILSISVQSPVHVTVFVRTCLWYARPHMWRFMAVEENCWLVPLMCFFLKFLFMLSIANKYAAGALWAAV